MEQKITYADWDEGKIAELLNLLQGKQNIKIIVSVENTSEKAKKWEEKIAGYYLNKLGIPVHLRGYAYLKYGIMRCIECPEELESVTKILYPRIAKKYQTTSSKVEHGMRHAITKAWEEKEKKEWERIFGGGNKMTKPTNSQFLAAVTDYIKINN